MQQKNILPEYWEFIEQKNTKIAKKIYNVLNRDIVSAIYLDGDVFYIETTSSYSPIPNYVYNHIKNWGKKHGYTYLYDLK